MKTLYITIVSEWNGDVITHSVDLRTKKFKELIRGYSKTYIGDDSKGMVESIITKLKEEQKFTSPTLVDGEYIIISLRNPSGTTGTTSDTTTSDSPKNLFPDMPWLNYMIAQ